MLITIFCSWVHLVDDLTEGWVLGAFLCKFDSFAQVIAVVSSTLSLSLIACDRFFGIVFAMKAHIIERRASYSIALIWLCSIAIATPLLFTRSLEEFKWRNHLEVFCKDEWPAEETIDVKTGFKKRTYPSRVAYWTILSVILYFLPVLVMAAVYVVIMKTLLTTRAPGEMVGAEISVQTKMKRKVVVMLALILVVFALCWFPLQACILYMEYRPDQTKPFGEWYDTFTFFSYALAYSNSALNPIIYTGFNQNFRKGFRALFRCYEKPHYTTVSRVDSFHSSTIVTKVCWILNNGYYSGKDYHMVVYIAAVRSMVVNGVLPITCMHMHFKSSVIGDKQVRTLGNSVAVLGQLCSPPSIYVFVSPLVSSEWKPNRCQNSCYKNAISMGRRENNFS
ncbi:hypothetical protein ScPMuIL_005091 [Solemya velum]